MVRGMKEMRLKELSVKNVIELGSEARKMVKKDGKELD